MNKQDEIKGRLARITAQVKDKTEREVAVGRQERGAELSSELREFTDRAALDLIPQMQAFARLNNRSRFSAEYSRFPGSSHYLSKGYWERSLRRPSTPDYPGGIEGGFKRMFDTPTNDAVLRDLQALSDEVVMLHNMMRNDIRFADKSIAECCDMLETYHQFKEELRPFTEKALSTTGVGTGFEWIPTEFSADLIDEVRLNTMVANLFRVIPMPAATYVLPTSTSRPRAYIASQATTADPTGLRSSNVGTGSVTLTTVPFAVRVDLSYEFVEDSIIAALPMVREKIVLGLADGVEDATLNGDTAAAHIDTGLQATIDATPDDVRKAAFDGLRKLTNSGAKVDFDTGTEAFTTTNFRAIRKGMGKYALRPDEGAWLSPLNAYFRMLSLAEVITIDKYGPSATILSGQMASFDGSPIVVSEYLRSDLNVSGIYDATTTTQSAVLYVHRPSFVYGERRGVTVEMETRPSRQQHIMVATLRRDFKGVRSSTDNSVGWGYDFAA